MRWERFEVGAERDGKWELVGAFPDLDVASAVARNYTYRMKLVRAVFEGDQRLEEQVLAHLGSTRQRP